jgi:hypothetical protein
MGFFFSTNSLQVEIQCRVTLQMLDLAGGRGIGHGAAYVEFTPCPELHAPCLLSVTHH